MKFRPKVNKTGYIEAFPKPSKIFLDNFYEKIYFKKKVTKSFSSTYSKNEKTNKIVRAKFEINFIKQKLKKEQIKFLEIGSGEGFILKEASKQNKWKIKGVDFNSFGIKKFNKSMLKNFVQINPNTFLENAILKKLKFDVVVLNNVLEHVTNPKILMSQIYKITSKSSIILISVPNDFSSLQLEAIKNKKLPKIPWFQPPQHLSYFNTENIKKFLKKCNFKIIDSVSNFPIEFFLFSKFSFFYNNSLKGKEVYKARIFLENLIYQKEFKDAYNFFNSCVKVGFGRNFSVLVKKGKSK
tara:strand:+ start:1869 stop:2759 length:891 start_codon:yes stop_codon:yes gene_type:complete